jgi:hypothetical protein
MPRPLPSGGQRRRAVPLRLSEEEERPVRELADREHIGNLSEALRALIADGLRLRGMEMRARELASKDETRMDEFGAGEVFAARQILGPAVTPLIGKD